MQMPEPERRTRRIVLTVAAVVCIYLGLESLLPVRVQPSAYALVGAIRVYQAVGSPLIGKVVHCKYQPTCSHYGAASIMKYGTVRGTLRTMGRLWRCSPWGPPPGQDAP